MTDINTFELFNGKTFSNLTEDIYNNSKEKDIEIRILINSLTPMIQSISDAALVVPLIKEYLNISVRNDEQLVKLLAIIQKAVSSPQKSIEFNNNLSGLLLTEEEKTQLYNEVNKSDIIDEVNNIDTDINKLKNQQYNTIVTDADLDSIKQLLLD